MSRILTIGKPYILFKNNKVRLVSDILFDGCTYNIWYEYDKEYSDYLCVEKADPFIINLLLFCMQYGYDLKSEKCMSSRLYYTITNYLIPTISKNIHRYSEIRIIADVSSKVLESFNGTGASLSCGVDSLYTIYKHLNCKDKEYNITHLNFYNAGSNGNYGGEEARELFRSRVELLNNAAKEINIPFICVDTNINEILGQRHVETHTFRTLAIVLSLQKLYSKYYFASGFPFEKFNINEFDPGEYDLLNVSCLSTENISIFLSGAECTRLDKIRYLNNFDFAKAHLNVCVRGEKNCGKCEKCQRTIMELDYLNVLEDYSSVFDLNAYYSNRRKFLTNVVAMRNHHDWDELYYNFNKSERLTICIKAMGNIKLIYLAIRKNLSRIKLVREVYEKYFVHRY